MNDSEFNTEPFNGGDFPAVLTTQPDPRRGTSVRSGPDPRRGTSVRVGADPKRGTSQRLDLSGA